VGNRVQIVEYVNIQFTKHHAVLDGIVVRTDTNRAKLSRNLPKRG